jgi:hydrogenase maturation protease
MNASCPTRITVLGIGNVLWADEGFGVRCLEALQNHYEMPQHVQVVDGGTQGLYLIQFVQDCDCLLIFDAIDYGLTPGTLLYATDEDVPKYFGVKKMSLHQTAFQEVLALAQLTGHYPKHVALIGCQPEELDDYGGSLRACVKAAIPAAIAQASAQLAVWGTILHPCSDAGTSAQNATCEHLKMAAYENGRPSAEQACRTGDSRFMPRPR